MANKVYDIITSQIIAQLEKGVIPWKQSWTEGGLPRNGASNKQYNGINTFLLASRGYINPNWFTFNQVADMGGHVKKGEKATMVIFWKKFTPANVRDDPNRRPGEISGSDLEEHLVMRYYNVFNYEQTEGLNAVKYASKTQVFNPISAAEDIVNRYPNAPKVQHEYQRAYYMPAFDTVNMPKKETFVKPEFYYKTLFHELTHSTGHESRLNRPLKGFAESNKQDYSKEELIAEMGASFLSGRAGIFEHEQLEESTAYIQSWIKVLKNDTQMVIKAASAAQKAADFITAAN